MVEVDHQHSMEMAVLLLPKNVAHIFVISGEVGYFFSFFFLCCKRAACWLNQRTFFTLLGELNFDLCEPGLQSLTYVDFFNWASPNINLQNWRSFLWWMHFCVLSNPWVNCLKTLLLLMVIWIIFKSTRNFWKWH